MNGPAWVNVAGRYLGVAETPGKETTPAIRRWLIQLNAWWSDDETPWCGVFCAQVMRELAIPTPKAWYRARAWLLWGTPLDEPVLGAIAVFDGGKARPGAGHVGIVAGRDARGFLLVLGGNQGNRVSIAAFDPARLLGLRWPPLQPLPTGPLLAVGEAAPVSHSEA